MKTSRINKILVGLLLLGIIGFASCKKEEVVKVFGFVQGFVYDGATNTIIDDVDVNWQVAGKEYSTTASQSEGFYIDNLYSGEYAITFSKDNYSKAIYWVEVPMDDYTATVKGGANKEYMVSVDPKLYPLTAGLTGRVYKSENSLSIPVSGAIVRVEYGNENMIPDVYQTLTNDNGYYTFTNLPASGYQVTLRVLEYTDGNGEKYASNSVNINLNAGSTLAQSAITLSRVADPLLLINTNLWLVPGVTVNNFPINSDITIEFSKEISEALTEDRGSITLGGTAFTTTYSGNTVTINPTANLAVSTNYTLSYTVYGTRAYETRSGNISFRTTDAK